MVQEFHVLRCFSCQSFQVQQVKKVNRWSCKVCGEKQSLLKEFGRGSGADCRRHVQKLNAMRGAIMEEQDHNTCLLWKQVEADGEDEPEEQRDNQVTQTQVSCWSKYLNSPEEADPEEKEEANVLMDRQQLHGNYPNDRKRKRNDRWTDRGGQDRCTPEQSNWSNLIRPSGMTRTSSLSHTSPPSKKTISPPSQNHTSPPSKKTITPPSQNHTSPPSKKTISPPGVSRWACFISSGCQVNDEGAEPALSGISQSAGGSVSLSCDDIIRHTPSLHRPRPLLPVSSLFQSGDEFSFDDEDFVAAQRF